MTGSFHGPARGRRPTRSDLGELRILTQEHDGYVDVQAWTDPHPSADAFEEPASGAALFLVLR